jgi:phage FluMu protein Com
VRLRDLILRFMSPTMQAEAEADSRKWIATCPRCQKANSIWDIGGMRYKGTGRPMTLVRCTHCSKASFMRFEKQG